MRVYLLKMILCMVCLWPACALGTDQPLVDYGRWGETQLEQLIVRSQQFVDPGERIAELSRPFLGTPYVEGSMIGGPQTPEQLVINLAGVDCFTFLDLIEALRRSAHGADLPERLRQVRYRNGRVAYSDRRHFFSDWVTDIDTMVADVTADVSGGKTRNAAKQLNLKNDGTLWLPGIPVIRREVVYIPAEQIDQALLSGLRTGDYAGIYTERAGLDVSHVGLIVKSKEGVMFRHASSLKNVRQVVDVDLLEYLQGKPGLVVYRAFENHVENL